MRMFQREFRRYTFSEVPSRGAKAKALPVSLALYADVSLDVNIKDIAERLFTYEIPENLQGEVFVGTQVLVPFGRQELVSGFVVSIRSRTDERSATAIAGHAPAIIPDQTKPITDVLDSKPIFDPSYIDFLYWISEYYLCSISDVLQAAVPAEVGPRVKRTVRLCEHSRSQLIAFSESPAKSNEENKIRQTLESAGKNMSIKSLKDKSGIPAQSFYSVLARMRRKGDLEVVREAEEGMSPKLVSVVTLTGEPANTKRQEEILNYLKKLNGSAPLKQFLEETKSSESTIKRMANEGILTIARVDSFRDPLKNVRREKSEKANKPELTGQQAAVLEVLSSQLDECLGKENKSIQENGSPSLTQSSQSSQSKKPGETEAPWLLQGVTGSGKTEVYLRLIEQALSAEKSALLLVPEISLTPQLAQRLVSRFPDTVAIWHSGLSPGERFDTWRRLQSGELRVLLGARSAILAHIPNLALIILDEEHDSSYKQSSPNPRYSAKKLAMERSRREGCFVLFGSATPDSITYFESRAANRILLLPERVHKQALPQSTLVDMRQEQQAGNRSIFSRYLQDELKACLERKEQSILLINRRGYASHVFCRACGNVIRCKHCSVSLVYHSFQTGKVDSDGTLAIGNGRLTCHHCGFNRQAPKTCPDCNSPFLRQLGLGTQKVEEEARALYPDARILRLDSDITARKGAYEEIFHEFKDGNADILIGTQIVAKGLDIDKVTLVGVLAADAAFNLPDFRSLERGFQLLTQVSGRAGRGHYVGKVVLQTFNMDLPALLLAKAQNFEAFIAQELKSREEFLYPPFSRLIRIVASGPNDDDVRAVCDRVAEELSNYLEEIELISILGPAPCLIERIKGQFRHHILVKNMAGELGHKAISSFLRGRSGPPGVRLTFDVDPIDLI